MPDGIPSTTNGTSLQQQELGLIQDRNLLSSPSPSLYSPHSKSSFIKGGLAQSSTKKQLLAGQTGVDSTRGLLQWVQSISLIGVSIDHSLHLILQADMSSAGESIFIELQMCPENQICIYEIMVYVAFLMCYMFRADGCVQVDRSLRDAMQFISTFTII